MAFPTTSVLDNFNRANGALGANYSNEPFNDTTEGSFAILSNQVDIPTDAYASVWYNVATYGPDSEAYLDVVTADAAAFYAVYLRIQSPSASSSTGDGYKIEQVNGTGLSFYRMDNGVATELGTADATTNIASGDGFGAEIIGSTLTAYRRSSGVWSAYGTTRTDSTYSGAGYIGFQAYDLGGTSVFDNFGGGTVVVTSPGARKHRRGRMGMGR